MLVADLEGGNTWGIKFGRVIERPRWRFVWQSISWLWCIVFGINIFKLIGKFIQNILFEKLGQSYLLYIYFYEVFGT